MSDIEYKKEVSELLSATTNILSFLDGDVINFLEFKAKNLDGEVLEFSVENGLALHVTDRIKEIMTTRLAELETSYFIRKEDNV